MTKYIARQGARHPHRLPVEAADCTFTKNLVSAKQQLQQIDYNAPNPRAQACAASSSSATRATELAP
eukprot:4902106-Pleurochrysis_carterae.AAC.3